MLGSFWILIKWKGTVALNWARARLSPLPPPPLACTHTCTKHSGPEHAYVMCEITENPTFANILPNKFVIYAVPWFSLVSFRELLRRQLMLMKEFAALNRRLQFQFINKVRTRPIINVNILDWIKLIKKCSVVVVIVYVCGRNDDSSAHKIVSVLCSGAFSAHTTCVPRPSPTKPRSGPPLPTGSGLAKRTAPERGTERSH